MQIASFFDKRTYTVTYVVYDAATLDAVVIDPVLDYEPASSRVWTESLELVASFVKEKGLKLHYILETHAHADHLSGAQELKRQFPQAKLAVGARITEVQKVFKGVFDLPDDFATDGRQFDLLLQEGDTLKAGTIEVETIYTPGHTPACATYRMEDAIFTGDALFMPDMGTGRCDFPGGSATDLYDSIQKLYALPDSTRVFVGHDYAPGGREYAWETTVGEQKAKNIQLAGSTSREDFVTMRTRRDKTLDAPRLLFQSVQVNIDAGRMPEPHANQTRYLRIPINVFKPVVTADARTTIDGI
ncbi:MAG: MBL fold metallo-hydrolase [Myxococcales bacterium]|nr:MBL fold metallo-hydrolase [Myxococcales bacterium]